MTGLTRKWAARCKARVRASSPRAVILTGGLCLVVLAGAAWLVVELASSRPEYKPLTARPMDRAQLALAKSLAESRGIDFRVENSRVMVPAECVERLAAMLENADSSAPDGLGGAMTFEQLASSSNIWSTRAQSDKRWQAAKMAKLGSLISQWSRVRRATVIIEPGSGPGLGRAATRPTAAVHIAMAEGSRVDGRLVAAIADLVSGSVVGMVPEHVCIVDSTGRSYRPGDDVQIAAEDRAEQLRRAEAYHAGRVREAVGYIPSAVVSVSVVGDEGVGRCKAASVSVPRSYLAAAMAVVDGNSADPNDAEFDAFAAETFARVRRAVARAVDLETCPGDEPSEAIKVDWYYDTNPTAAAASAVPVALASAEAPAAVPSEPGLALDGEFLAAAGCWSLGLLGLLCGVLAIGRHGMLRRAARQQGGDQADRADDASLGSESADPLARLRRADSEQLRTMLDAEHPQTQALILAQVAPETAAEVMAGWSPELQVDVSRRVAALGRVEPAVVSEALGGLIEQWTESAGPEVGGDSAEAAAGAGGAGKVARILNHAGGATEKAVLDGLAGLAPALAESIRKRMFVFDDIALLPRTVLRSALESLAGDELAIALRTASEVVTEKVLSSLPRAAASKVRREMDRIGPVRLSDVEAAQERVVAAVHRLEDGLYTSAPARKGSEVLA